MSELETIIERIARRVVAEEIESFRTGGSVMETPWMTELELAEYWGLRKNGQPTVHAIRKWTVRDDHPLPCGRMGETRRYDRQLVDKWAGEEADRYKQRAQLRKRQRPTKNSAQRRVRDNLQVL